MAKSLSQLLKNLRSAFAREEHECETLLPVERGRQLDKDVRQSLATDLPDPKTATLVDCESYVTNSLLPALRNIGQGQEGLVYQHCFHLVSGYYKLADDTELRDAAQEESSYLKRSLAAVKNFKDAFLNLKENAAVAPDDTSALYNKILEAVQRLEAKLIEIERILKSDDLRNELQKFIEANNKQNSAGTQNETKLPLHWQLGALTPLAVSAAYLSTVSLEAALITGIPAVLAALNVSREQLKMQAAPAEDMLNTFHNGLNRAFENDIEVLGHKHEDVKAMLGDITKAIDSIKSIVPVDSGLEIPLNEATLPYKLPHKLGKIPATPKGEKGASDRKKCLSGLAVVQTHTDVGLNLSIRALCSGCVGALRDHL